MNKNYTLYIHINKINNKCYVGITNRKPEIRWGLNGNGYKNQPKFYNAIQKYGWDNFYHIILFSNLSQNEALTLETEHIQKYNSIKNGYNILLKGIQSYPRNKPIYCKNLNKIYSSIKEASLDLHIDSSAIIENCKGRRSPIKGNDFYYWDNINNTIIDKTPFQKKKPNNIEPVLCIELNKVFPSINDCAKELQIDESGLDKALNGSRNGIKGMHFVKIKDLPNINLLELLCKKTGKERKVYCMETQQIFNSLQDAANFCNKTPQSIMKNCQGKTKTCGGYHFQYYDIFLRYKGDMEEDEE